MAPGAAGTLRIVVVGGSARAADDVAAAFARAGSAASCVRVATPRGLRGALRRGSCDVVVVDCALRRLDVLAAIAHVVEFGADLPVVAVSAVLDELALDILRAGAADYLLKADLDRLPAVVLQARRRADERRELHAVRERLSASEERFRTLAEATNQIVWTLGADGEADGPIDDWTAFTGQSPAEFAGRGWLDVVHTDDRERALRDWQTAVADGASYRSEYRLKMKGDGYRWMSSQAVPLRDAAGVVEQWIGADRDVTDHLKVVRDLAVAQDYNARVMAISPAFFCAVSADGRIVLMNQAMLDHLGYALDDVVGTEFAGLLIFDGDRAALEAEIWRALSDNASVTTELRMQAADGAEVLVEWRAAPVFAADGAFDHAVGVGVDVTERRCAVESLQRSDERYRTLSRTASSWVWTAALDGQPVEPFASFLEFTGMSAADLNGAGWLAAVHADDRQSTSAVWAASVASVAEVRLEYRLRRGDGEYEWFSVHGSPVLDNEGRLVEYVGTSINVHQRNLALEALRESEQRHRALFEQVPVGVFVYDRDLRVTECNLELARMMGVAPARLTGGDLRALAGGDVVVALEAAIAGEIGAFEGAFHVAGEGASPMVTMHTSPLRAADGAVSGGMAVVADVSERHRFFDRIDRLAFTDLVTGLPNRTAFDCRLQEAISLAALSRHKVALAVLNIDRFRRVHDTMGARAADRLLSAVGARLAGQVGRNDTVARASADEFLVLLPEVTGIDDIVAVSDRIAAGFRSAIQVDGEPIYVQFSIGVALCPDDADETDALLRNATIAMRRAKRDGGGARRFYDADMDSQPGERLALENELHRALDNGELAVHFQPLVRGARGAVVGVEALVRWQHPQRGLLPPAAFIPLAEDTGLIVPMGEWVLATACRQVKAWHDAGLATPRLAVNLSGRQLGDDQLLAKISRALEESGLAARFLEIEITETAVMADTDQARATICQLRKLGVRIALDDFGTGYSSLSLLSSLPIRTVKIDRSFVTGMLEHDRDMTIVTTVIALGHRLGLNVVAEGVETRAQFDALRGHGCDEMQGYLFARPLCAPECEALLRRGRLLG